MKNMHNFNDRSENFCSPVSYFHFQLLPSHQSDIIYRGFLSNSLQYCSRLTKVKKRSTCPLDLQNIKRSRPLVNFPNIKGLAPS